MKAIRGIAALAAAASLAAAAATPELGFHEVYAANGVLGLQFSAAAKSLSGKRARIRGFAAPPLKAEGNFFVLGRSPTSLCPFCNSDADWPLDIVVVYPRDAQRMPRGSAALMVEGTLELGPGTDAPTGFVSQMRLVDATFEAAKW